jgi:ribonuclease HI
MAEIKIFLASSNELKADRNQFEILIRRKNDEWKAEGKPYLNLEIWEEVSEAMSTTVYN